MSWVISGGSCQFPIQLKKPVQHIRIGMLVNKKIFEFINSNFIETGEQNYYIESNSIPKPLDTDWLYIGVQKDG
ncbi:MAG: hypothetical protein RSA45_06585, partial [Hydrogenoanaerobacterium sp.]